MLGGTARRHRRESWHDERLGGAERSMVGGQAAELDAQRVVIRPMTQADLPGMRESTRAAIRDLQERLGSRPEPDGRPAHGSPPWTARYVGRRWPGCGRGCGTWPTCTSVRAYRVAVSVDGCSRRR